MSKKKLIFVSLIIVIAAVSAVFIFLNIPEKPETEEDLVRLVYYNFCKAVFEKDLGLYDPANFLSYENIDTSRYTLPSKERCEDLIKMVKAKEENSKILCNNIDEKDLTDEKDFNAKFLCINGVERDDSLCNELDEEMKIVCEDYLKLIFDEMSYTNVTTNYYFNKAWIRDRVDFCEKTYNVTQLRYFNEENFQNVFICRAMLGVDTCDQIKLLS